MLDVCVYVYVCARPCVCLFVGIYVYNTLTHADFCVKVLLDKDQDHGNAANYARASVAFTSFWLCLPALDELIGVA